MHLPSKKCNGPTITTKDSFVFLPIDIGVKHKAYHKYICRCFDRFCDTHKQKEILNQALLERHLRGWKSGHERAEMV